MAKSKTVFVCTDCGAEFAKWQGQCTECKAWNTLSQLSIDSPYARDAGGVAAGHRYLAED